MRETISLKDESSLKRENPNETSFDVTLAYAMHRLWRDEIYTNAPSTTYWTCWLMDNDYYRC
jgi:hypothetical protein